MQKSKARGLQRSYTMQFREHAIHEVIEVGKSRTQVAQELSIPLSTLNSWVARRIGTLGTGSGNHNRYRYLPQ